MLHRSGEAEMTTTTRCTCAHHSDGSTTTMLCPQHAHHDPCATMASVTGRRRKGSIRRGVCSSCGWTEPEAAEWDPIPLRDAVRDLGCRVAR